MAAGFYLLSGGGEKGFWRNSYFWTVIFLYVIFFIIFLSIIQLISNFSDILSWIIVILPILYIGILKIYNRTHGYA